VPVKTEQTQAAAMLFRARDIFGPAADPDHQ
jgi:hypothetical protein